VDPLLRVSAELEQSAGVSRVTLRPINPLRDQWSELRINLAASDKQGRPDEALHGDAQSGTVKNLLTIPT
jgi:hypothetical protein